MTNSGKAWWRAWAEAGHDPKLQRLRPALFKHWFNLVCLACSNGGCLPPLSDCSRYLSRLPLKRFQSILSELHSRGLFDLVDGKYIPHNWQGRQYLEGSSTERGAR